MVDVDYRVGDRVVYLKTKFRPRPSRRAVNVSPTPNGDDYTYQIPKFWLVTGVEGDELVLMSKRGKIHRVPVNDPSLRRATWWERWRFHHRFPERSSSQPVRSG